MRQGSGDNGVPAVLGELTLEMADARLAIMGKKSEPILFIGRREGDHVAIEPLAKVVSGWRTANIAVRCGVWTGHYAGQFMQGELAKLGKEIEYLCEGLKPKVEFKSVEHYLNVALVKDGHGHIHAEGEARERLGSKSALEFEFEVDGATLAEVARALIEADRVE